MHVSAAGTVLVWQPHEAFSRVIVVVLASCCLKSPQSCWSSSLGIVMVPEGSIHCLVECEDPGHSLPWLLLGLFLLCVDGNRSRRGAGRIPSNFNR